MPTNFNGVKVIGEKYERNKSWYLAYQSGKTITQIFEDEELNPEAVTPERIAYIIRLFRRRHAPHLNLKNEEVKTTD